MTPAVKKRICKYISEGLPRCHAAALAGISRDTFYDHQAKFSDFSDAVKKATAKFVRTHVRRIVNAGRTSWQASAWFLERVCPQEFGRVDRHQLRMKHEGIVPLPEEYIAAINQALGVTGEMEPLNLLPEGSNGDGELSVEEIEDILPQG